MQNLQLHYSFLTPHFRQDGLSCFINVAQARTARWINLAVRFAHFTTQEWATVNFKTYLDFLVICKLGDFT